MHPKKKMSFRSMAMTLMAPQRELGSRKVRKPLARHNAAVRASTWQGDKFFKLVEEICSSNSFDGIGESDKRALTNSRSSICKLLVAVRKSVASFDFDERSICSFSSNVVNSVEVETR